MALRLLSDTSCYIDDLQNYISISGYDLQEIREAENLLCLKREKLIKNLEISSDLPKLVLSDQKSLECETWSNLKILKIRRYLFIKHCLECQNTRCQNRGCNYFKSFLLEHIKTCSNQHCCYPYCNTTRGLLIHYHQCIDKCLVCRTFTNLKKRTDSEDNSKTLVTNTNLSISSDSSKTTHSNLYLTSLDNQINRNVLKTDSYCECKTNSPISILQVSTISRECSSEINEEPLISHPKKIRKII